MAKPATLDVSKWQESRREWAYTPVLWFYFRVIETAYLDAHAQEDGRPTDEALLARDWIATSLPGVAGAHRFVSFPECCEMLGLDAERERLALLEAIDKAVDSDNDEAWARLDELAAREPQDDVEPLFDAPRVVPALDQMALF